MRSLRNATVSIILSLVAACTAHAQCGIMGGAITIVDGAITLNGTFEQLAGIEALSAGGYLSLDSVMVDDLTFDLTAPFADAAVVTNRPTSVVFGVLGANNRINVEGMTRTSILYSESERVGESDLRVNLGLANSPPAVFPPPPLSETGCATVDNGKVRLHGLFSDVTSVEATSAGGFLGIQETDGVKSTSPFFRGQVVTDTAELVSLGLSDGFRPVVLFGGDIHTAILYSASSGIAVAGDLTITLGMGDEKIGIRVVPEPSAGILALFALPAMAFRRRRAS